MDDCYFIPDGKGFAATEHTRGPWDPRFQHAGPPAALLGRALESLAPDGMRVVRFTIEILKPIPIATLHVEARAVRTSKRVQLGEAVMRAGDEEVAFARAWRMRVDPGVIEATPQEPPTAPGPDGLQPGPGWAPPGASYFSSMEWRFGRGAFFEAGPAAAWMRMRVGLVQGEPIRPLSRVLAAADSGNGISATVDVTSALFINTELTVHLFRMPVGEWVLLDATTRIEADGIGVTTSKVSDERSLIGSGAQALLCEQRR